MSLKINDYPTIHQVARGKILIVLNADKNTGKLDLSYIAGWNMKWTIGLENVLQFIIELNIYLSYNLAIAPLDIYLRKRKIYWTKICIQMLLAICKKKISIVKDLTGNNSNVLTKVNDYKN